MRGGGWREGVLGKILWQSIFAQILVTFLLVFVIPVFLQAPLLDI